MPGEAVRIVARGLLSRAPIAVRVGTATFALRLFEAACIRVCPEQPQLAITSMDAAPSAPIPLIALVGNPNCGKTALFNMLTGSRQKVANYAGVTVERKEGSLLTPSGLRIRILDLPGAYSLDPLTPDEQVTADVLLGRSAGETSTGFRRLRDRRDQSAPEPTIGVEPETLGVADGGGAQHERHRTP